jgi:hypothetical protein
VHEDCFTTRHLLAQDGHRITNEEEDTIKFVAAGLYAGGADTVGLDWAFSFILIAKLTLIR